MTDETAGRAGAETTARRLNREAQRLVADKPWGDISPEDVRLLPKGEVRPARVPILEALRDPSSVVGEELRLVSSRVRDISRQRKIGCVALTSALPGEGKSTLAVGLAAALGRQPGRRVLLIEADLRRPSLASALGLAPSAGLSEWLHGHIDHLPVRVVEPGGFSLLVAGLVSLEEPEVLGSSRMDALLRASRGVFDYVLLDTPPLVPVTDATMIQDLVDGFLLVVRHRLTPRDAVQQGLAKLRQGRVLGIIMNDYNEILPTYTAYAYRRYGMAYGPSGREKGPSPGGKGRSRR
jgi:capsular exopolysaccharide synthesis family protein